MTSVTMTPVTLQNRDLRLTVLPELGASVGGFELQHQGFWVPLMRPTALATLENRVSPDTSSYILAPYSNRVKDGRFNFRGKAYQMRPNWVDGRQIIHGEVHGRAWEVAARADDSLTCRFEADDPAALNFPFPYRVEVTYALDGLTQRTRLSLTNTGAEPMPAGMGFHPFFPRRFGWSGDALLSFEAGGVYQTDRTLIPGGPAAPLTPELDFSKPKTLGDLRLDHVFAGWGGRLRLDWPQSGVALVMEADPVFSHFVVFTSPDGTAALEPVTHATDGFNLMERGVPETGVRVLEPGEGMTGEYRLRVERQGSGV